MLTSIYNYTDYRSALRDFYVSKKKQNSRFSYGVWARQLGLKSPSSLAMIIGGQRNPGTDLIQSLAANLKLKEKEREYFTNLVSLRKTSGDIRLNVLVMEKLGNDHPDGEFNFLDHESFNAISNWHYYAIREMVSLSDFVEDYAWISKRLISKVTAAEARKAIETLLKLELLCRSQNGKLKQASGHFNTPGEDVTNEALQRFHEQVLTMAKEAIRDFQPQERELFSTTFSMKKTSLPKAKELIRQFHKRFCKLLETDNSDEVFQLELAFFPLTRRN